jgi:hypothetical protein
MLFITRTFIVFIVFLLLLPLSSAETANYCSDPEINQEWEHLIHKNSHHPEWREMYKLRK